MPETFVPLTSVVNKSRDTIFTAYPQTISAGTSAKSATPSGTATAAAIQFAAPAAKPNPGPAKAAPHTEACANPVITLQRTGDIVSSIRIQCPCGQVIDVACAY